MRQFGYHNLVSWNWHLKQAYHWHNDIHHQKTVGNNTFQCTNSYNNMTKGSRSKENMKKASQ